LPSLIAALQQRAISLPYFPYPYSLQQEKVIIQSKPCLNGYDYSNTNKQIQDSKQHYAPCEQCQLSNILAIDSCILHKGTCRMWHPCPSCPSHLTKNPSSQYSEICLVIY
jgi:hypothetical protein